MSNVTWWVGPADAIAAELLAAGKVAEGLLITEASLSPDLVRDARWVGIAPPPDGATVFTLHAPIEASGRPEWAEYRRGFAPECELVAARVPA